MVELSINFYKEMYSVIFSIMLNNLSISKYKIILVLYAIQLSRKCTKALKFCSLRLKINLYSRTSMARTLMAH